MSQTQFGVVSEFDPQVGLGQVASEDGAYRFHCTEIADGSRVIVAGTAVSFVVIPGHLGEWEASAVRPRPLSQLSG